MTAEQVLDDALDALGYHISEADPMHRYLAGQVATLQAENEKMKKQLRGLGAPRDDATRFLCIKETHVWDSDLAYRTSPEITADQRRAQAELIVRCGHAKRVKYLDSALAQEAGDGR